MKLKVIAQSMRLPFLLLTPACLFLGWSVVIEKGISVESHLIVFTLFAAVLAHLSVNLLNEYSDFRSGLDLNTVKTPFSGGSGALPAAPEMAVYVLLAGLISLAGVILTGLYFVRVYGWEIAPLGFAGLLIIVFYTGWINKHPLLCLIAPGTGFGLFMVTGSAYVFSGEYLPEALLLGLVAFFQVNNLLLLNQYPDIEADRQAGRNHAAIAWGITISNRIYLMFVLLIFATIVAGIVTALLPLMSLVSLLFLLPMLFALKGAVQYREKIGQYPQYLAANVLTTILLPVVLGMTIISA